jgi:hypothetical protein
MIANLIQAEHFLTVKIKDRFFHLSGTAEPE